MSSGPPTVCIKAIKQQILLFEVNYVAYFYRKHYHVDLKDLNISVFDF